MKIKQVLSWMLALVCLAVMVCPVSAAPSVTVTVGTATAAPGDTVTVPVSVSQIEGIGAIGIHVKYDPAVLECVKAETAGLMNEMDTNTANTTPVNHKGEVWLTGMCLNGVAGSGNVMIMTFKVKDNAPDGLSAITLAGDYESEFVNANDLSYLSVTAVSGGVAVSSGAAVPTTQATSPAATVPDATPSDNTATESTAPTTTAAPVTRPNGETVTVTEVTVVGVDGTVVTTPQGEPLKVQTVAVVVDEVAAKAGERVTVNVSTTAVSDITALGIDISFDADVLSFVSGTTSGFVAAEANASNVACNQEGVVVISATDPMGISGQGVVAQLTFEVKRSAKAGESRLALSPEPVVIGQSGAAIPVTTYAGHVSVTAVASTNTWVYIVLGTVVAAGALAAVMLGVSRRKKAAQ